MTAWAGRSPRRWQAEALPLALGAIRARERGVVTAIMGSGKSILLAEICASGQGRVLVTVPTVALVEQLAATLEARCPGAVGTYYTSAKVATRRITVCCLPSVPTLIADPAWPGPPALWIADEAHKSEAATILEAYQALAPERALGFTATPFRADESQRLSLWDREIYVYGVADAVRDGVIVPIRPVPWQGRDEMPLDAACITMIRGELARAKQGNGGGPGLANAVSIDDAEGFAALLSKEGIRASAVHSRMPRPDVAKALDDLRKGDLDAVVHVNMLSEGVDLPWLRWLCMRRPVGSRVRFCQEVGRVLRSAPGKREAALLDPHDLLGAFALSYEAILAGGGEEKERTPFERKLKEAEEALSPRPAHEPPPAAALSAWRAYLRSIYLAALGVGLIESRITSTKWRKFPASERQIATATRAVGSLARSGAVPKAHGKALQALAAEAPHLTRGDCSDLISICFSALDAKRAGRDFWSVIVGATDT